MSDVKPQPEDQEDAVFKKLVLTLTAAQRRTYIDACLDEFESISESVKRCKTPDPASLKSAKSWGELQKKRLRILGHRKRLGVIGGKRMQPGSAIEEHLFDEKPDA